MTAQESVVVYNITSSDKEFILWCLDKANNTLCLRLPGHTEMIIEVLTVDPKGLIHGGSQNVVVPNPKALITKFVETYKAKYGSFGITSCSTVHRKEIYFYNRGITKPYLKIDFSTLRDFNQFKNLFFNMNTDGSVRKTNVVLEDGFEVRLRPLEIDIPLIWQFLHRFNIRPCSTIFLPGNANPCEEGTRISKCPREFTTPTVNPAPSDISVFPLIFSFDIESYSSDHNVFPNAETLDDIVFFIGIQVKRYRSEERGRNIGIYVMDPKYMTNFKDGEIICVKDERELLITFFKLLEDIQPQIVLSFNGLLFDVKYMHNRMEHYQLKYPNFSLLLNSQMNGEVRIKRFNWSSSAYKGINGCYFDIAGVVYMDMFLEIKRNYHLSSYTLNESSTYFLKDNKVDLKAKEMFRIYGNYQKGIIELENLIIIADYGIKDAILPLRLFDHLHQWTTYTQMCKIMNIQLIELIARGQTIRTKSNIYRVCRDSNMLINIPKDKPVFQGKFKGAFVGTMTIGIHDNVGVVDFSSLYPSIMARYNLSYDTFIHPRDWHLYKEEEFQRFIVETGGQWSRKIEIRYINKDIYKGIIPIVVEGFLAARKVEKKLAEKAARRARRTAI